MASILWIAVGVVLSVWVASMAVVVALVRGAHRGDPRVVMDDPWDAETGAAQRELARAQAAARARADAMRRERDFSRWEHETRGTSGSSGGRIVPQRPRPAA